MRSFIAPVLAAALTLGACTSAQVEKIQTASNNFQASVKAINAGIAAVAPNVAQGCADVQKWAMLIAPFVPNSGKAQQYLGAANGAIDAYCQNVPTDIQSTATAVAAAAMAAKNGYNQVKAGG